MGTIENAFFCDRRKNIIFKVKGFDHLLPGTPIAFMDKLEIKDEMISAQLDNVLSVAILIYMYHLGYQGTAFFTASEEAGKSWRFLLEYFKRFDITTQELLVLDTSPYKTIEDIKNLNVILRNRDENAVFRSSLKNRIKRIAIKNNINYHFKDEYIKNIMKQNNTKSSLGVTELGRIINESKNLIQGATLQIPTIEYHTSQETATSKSVKNAIDILVKIYL